MIDRKTPEEIAIMAQGGKLLGLILSELLEMSVVGVSLLEIEKVADRRITEVGATASFKTVSGYKWATCLCVNDEVVHGIPTEYKLKDGDILTIDIGLVYKGFHTDTAWTKIIRQASAKDTSVHPSSEESSPPSYSSSEQSTPPSYSSSEESSTSREAQKQKFLDTGILALKKAIEQAVIGNYIGNISEVIQSIVQGAGYNLVKSLVGHGVGRTLHEDPQVPGILKGAIVDTPKLIGGETIAIEIIYAQGDGAIEYSNNDGWTLVTRDRSLTSVFEHTVVVAADGPKILTMHPATDFSAVVGL